LREKKSIMPFIEIYKEFSFDAAHYLPNVPEGHKCKNMHGHTYHVKISAKGPIDEKLGWVEDFGYFKKIWEPIMQQLDHKVLNEVQGLENPTAELIAVWIWQQIIEKIPYLLSVEVKETMTSGAIYRGE
jgi:6-pyruvoyltetrahydropterin/6-carboxytetrahydropterin synthase